MGWVSVTIQTIRADSLAVAHGLSAIQTRSSILALDLTGVCATCNACTRLK